MNLVLTRGREGVQNLENLADIICASPLCVTFALEAGTKAGLAHDLRTTSRCAKLGRADSTTTRSDGCGCACASWSSLCFSWHAAGEMRVVLSSGEIKSTTDRVWFWGHTIAEELGEVNGKYTYVQGRGRLQSEAPDCENVARLAGKASQKW